MLSSAKIGTASWRYYTGAVACAATEYYLGVGEAPGRWHGRGLEALGLEAGGLVSEAQLEALFARALHPTTAERLGRAWRGDGVTGFDLTFSAPKSVSALWALGNPDVAAAAAGAHRAAVQAALSYLDSHAGLSRRGTDGTEQLTTDGLAVALFDHRTSRCADPQLHTHALVANKVRCADGFWRTLDASELFHHKKSAGMIYQAALRNELTARIDVAFEAVNEHGQAEIAGVPQELMKLWSKRTAAIETEAAPKIAEYETTLGRTLTAAERAGVVKTAVLKTRPDKTHPAPATLRQSWVAEAGAAGFTPPELMVSVAAAAQERPTPTTGTGAELLSEAVRAAGHARAVFSRADVAGQVAARLPAVARGADQTLAAVEELTEVALGLAEAVPVGEHPRGVTPRASDSRWASADVLAAEARVLSLAERGRGRGYGQVDGLLLDIRLLASGLDPGQREAVRQLAGDGDFLSVLTAPAGAGKTHTLGTATAAWQAAGYRVVGLAPSARAAGELAAATGGRADTLAKWLHNQTRLRALTVDELAWTLLDDGTVVVVDEASMANTLDLARLTATAARAAAKVVLVGDPAQIGVVRGPGGMLAALAHAGHGIELGSVHRFDQDWEREASLALRRGEPKILDIYQGAGRLHPCAGNDQAIEAVHAHWAAARADGAEVLMMARSRADVEALNARARAAQVAACRIGGPVNRLGERDWQVGDLLRARRNDRRILVGEGHVRNGDVYWVADAQGPGGGLIVSDLDGRNGAVLPPEYVAAHAEYGWAATVDAAQGATTGVGILLVRPGLDREHLYVGLTRGRAENHAYIAPDPAGEADYHGPARHGRPDRTPEQTARDVLAAALASSGAQDAAHTARARAAERAQQLAEEARYAAERTEAARRETRRAEVLAPTPQHAATIELLAQRRAERDQLRSDYQHHLARLDELRAEYADLPRFAPRRRPVLTDLIHRHETASTRAIPVLNRLDMEIKELDRQVDRDTTARQDAARREETRHLGQALTRQRPGRDLARPRPVEIVTAIGSRHAADLERIRQQHYTRSRDHHTRGRDRDDGYSIGR
ncbi:MAG TPA: MobF family relaxase [Sporichthyaceae bacterium]|nr:MobF family relaxase [Sporichthyaceae bacterium]